MWKKRSFLILLDITLSENFNTSQQNVQKSYSPINIILTLIFLNKYIFIINSYLHKLGPVPAVRSALAKAHWNIEDVDLFELNEAFAAQALAVQRELGVQEDKVTYSNI